MEVSVCRVEVEKEEEVSFCNSSFTSTLLTSFILQKLNLLLWNTRAVGEKVSSVWLG